MVIGLFCVTPVNAGAPRQVVDKDFDCPLMHGDVADAARPDFDDRG